jgi:hypothetical protein
LVLTSPTGGGRSVGIVRSRTKATEFSLVLVQYEVHKCTQDVEVGSVRVFISGPTFGNVQIKYFSVGPHITLQQWRYK